MTQRLLRASEGSPSILSCISQLLFNSQNLVIFSNSLRPAWGSSLNLKLNIVEPFSCISCKLLNHGLCYCFEVEFESDDIESGLETDCAKKLQLAQLG